MELLRARGVEVLQMTNAESSFVRDDGIVQNKEFDILRSTGMRWWRLRSRTLTPEKVRFCVGAGAFQAVLSILQGYACVRGGGVSDAERQIVCHPCDRQCQHRQC